ncbi:MAG: helix-turn-helix domain-containing protein [Planctomycetota bacterium]
MTTTRKPEWLGKVGSPIAPLPRLAVNVEEAAGMCGVGRDVIQAALQDGTLRHRRRGRLYIIPVDALREWLNQPGNSPPPRKPSDDEPPTPQDTPASRPLILDTRSMVAFTGIKPSTLRKLVKLRKIPHFYVGRRLLFGFGAIQQWADDMSSKMGHIELDDFEDDDDS